MQFDVFKDIELNGDNSRVQFEPDQLVEHEWELGGQERQQGDNSDGAYLQGALCGDESRGKFHSDGGGRLNSAFLERV